MHMVNRTIKAMSTIGVTGIIAFGLSVSTLALAQDDAAASKKEIKKEIEVPEGYTKPTVYDDLVYGNNTNNGGVFLGGSLAVGQARSTDGGSPGMAFMAGFEPGYQMKTGSWSRLEFGAQIFSGMATFRNPDDRGGKSTLSLGLGVLAKAGYGYSLGSGVMGVMKLGIGPVMAKYKGEVEDHDLESDSAMGLAAQFGYVVVFPASSSVDFTAGITYTHIQVDVGDVKDKTTGDKIDFDPINVNLPQAEFGLRFRL